MIKLLRVDDRLLHGAVAFSWTKNLSINLILVANDTIAKDNFTKMTLDMAKPRGTKLVVDDLDKSIELIRTHISTKINLMIVVNNIEDAYKIIDQVPEIKSLNLGGIREGKETVNNINGAVAMTAKDIELCKDLLSREIEVELRLVPDGKKTYLKDCKI